MRHLAHFVNFEGRKYSMAVAEISDDCRTCRIMPFTGEIHSTRFHNGEIEIRKDSAGFYEIKTGRQPK